MFIEPKPRTNVFTTANTFSISRTIWEWILKSVPGLTGRLFCGKLFFEERLYSRREDLCFDRCCCDPRPIVQEELASCSCNFRSLTPTHTCCSSVLPRHAHQQKTLLACRSSAGFWRCQVLLSAGMQFGLHFFVPGVRVSLVPSEAQLGMSDIKRLDLVECGIQFCCPSNAVLVHRLHTGESSLHPYRHLNML